ncbi:Integral membrane protein SED5, partial [Coemansia helicoidea]
RVVQVGALPILVEVLRAYLLGAEVVRLEARLNEARAAQPEQVPLAKVVNFATEPGMPGAEEHAEISDPSSTVMPDNILASGANHSTGASPSPSRSLPAAARSTAQAAAAAAVAAATGVNPIPVAVSAIHPGVMDAMAVASASSGPSRQQTRRIGEGVHPLARHVAYPDGGLAAGGLLMGVPGQFLPYTNHAYMYSEQERLQAEYDTARRQLQSITNVMYRNDDVVLTLQLLAYLSKTPDQRQLLHDCPLLSALPRPTDAHSSTGSEHEGGCGGEWVAPSDLDDAALAAQCAARESAAVGIPPLRRRPGLGNASVDVFAIVERFTAQKAYPQNMVHWSAIVMRNGCRRDESRNNCRQCAYLKCQRWERHPNEFSNEINALTSQVKQRISAINGKILVLQRLQRGQGGGGGGGQQAVEHHANVVISLQSQLATTSTAFKDVLELRSESLKESGSRKEQFIGTAAAAAGNLPFSSIDSPLYHAERQAPRAATAARPGTGSANDDFVALSLPNMDEASSSQMLLMQPSQSAYLDSRSEAITSIESTISELGSIFQQLAHMVSEQREVVQRIDANVGSVDANISAAQTELLKYYASISSNRWLIVKVFMVILVFVFLLVTFV